jgi:nucleotide-binding universal stress UspA family protein
MQPTKTFSKILVATDFSKPAEWALRQANWLAERCGAQLTLAHVLTDIRGAMSDMPASGRWELVAGDIDRFERELRRRSDERLARLTAKYCDAGVQLRHETLIGSPYVEIIHAVQKEGHDLVIVGTRGLSGLKRFLVGSTAERLVRQCPSPVWVVKGAGHSLRAIVVAVDFSEVSRGSLELGGALAAATGARLHVVHATFIPAEAASGAMPSGGGWTTKKKLLQYRQGLKQEAELRLSEFVKMHVLDGQPVRERVEHGEPWKVIGTAVRRIGADLIVMGTVAHSGIPGLFIGSTAEKVLRSCDCSILTVKPAGFVSSIQSPAWSLHPEGGS